MAPYQFELMLTLARSMGVLAIVTLVFAFILRHVQGRWAKQWTTGLLFGGAAILSMLDPARIAPGVIVDARITILGLAGPFGGPLAALVAALVVGGYRLWLGGAGAAAGAIGVAMAATAGIVFSRWVAPRQGELRLWHLAVLGAMTSLSILSFLAIPPRQVALDTLSVVGVPLLLATVLGTLVLGAMLRRERRHLQTQVRLMLSATTDGLTGLANRQSFIDAVEREIARFERGGEAPALLMLDCDHFKRVNDGYGHAVGDEVLKALGKVMRKNLRPCDKASRYGGEEFAVLLPSTDLDGGRASAERIRAAVEAERLPVSTGEITFTVSVGVAVHSPGDDAAALIRRADEAMYRAKARGRNRVEPKERATSPEPALSPALVC